ncbi:MAG TPA: alpha/beta hydrolase [Polyangiales bacterium]|nr:alpha/beta hydrolase [Polyangiales bacterium]
MAHDHFPGFEPFTIATSGATIHGVKGGAGPGLLLLHGWPQSHLEWRLIAPLLARDFSVVATDLRGYGESSKPPDGAGHSGYSKREMARDQVEVMQALGHTRFAVVGHDRGGRVAHRMALDHRERVERLAVIDIVPTLRLYSDMKKEFATAYFHWFLMLAPAPVPETLLSNSAEFMLRGLFGRALEHAIPEPIFAEYLRAFKDPATMHAMCEDYRAAASIDLEHDRADLANKLTCPLLTLWGEKGAMHPLYDVTATWRERATEVHGKALPGGHWLPEELPNETYAELRAWLVGL